MIVSMFIMRLFEVIIGCGGNDMICLCRLMMVWGLLMNGMSRCSLVLRVCE